MELVVSKPLPTRQETYKAIQPLGELTIKRYGEPTFDQLAVALNAVSYTLQNEARESLKTTKITDFFGEPLCKGLLHLSDNFKHVLIVSLHPAMPLRRVTQICKRAPQQITELIVIVRLSV